MGTVVMQASMSLDGYIADPSDQVGPLFDWYGNGEVEFTGADPDRVFRLLLENPQVVQGDRVTHLHYRLRKP